MGPKKAAKKGKGDDGEEDGRDIGEMIMILEAQRDSLMQMLVFEQERANLAMKRKQDVQKERGEKQDNVENNI